LFGIRPKLSRVPKNSFSDKIERRTFPSFGKGWDIGLGHRLSGVGPWFISLRCPRVSRSYDLRAVTWICGMRVRLQFLRHGFVRKDGEQSLRLLHEHGADLGLLLGGGAYCLSSAARWPSEAFGFGSGSSL
jgi:hypothetical protein